jgi:hypothetical protein
MPRSFDRFTTVWFDDRLNEVAAATQRGATQEAVDLLYHLWDQVHRDARSSVSEWHEIKVLWLLGGCLEKLGDHADAAREYRRIVRLRREVIEDASADLGPAACAAALCELRAGNRRAGLKLAFEALRLHASRPLPGDAADTLRAAIERAQRSVAKRPVSAKNRFPRSRPRASS